MTSHPSILIRYLRRGRTVVCADSGSPSAQRLHLSALKRSIDSLWLPLSVEVSEDGKRLRLDSDPGLLSASAVRRTIEAADSAVRSASASRSGTCHSLPVRLGGPSGPELGLAALLWGTTEKLLIRRLTRVPHAVGALAPPAASPLLNVPSAGSRWPPASSCRTEKAVEAGAIALSEHGITLLQETCYSDELVIGRVLETPCPPILPGDRVRLVHHMQGSLLQQSYC